MAAWHYLEFEQISKVTDDAVCYETADGRVWIPKTQISSDDLPQQQENCGNGSVAITEWVAKKRGLL